jgi:predicted amidohydrolase
MIIGLASKCFVNNRIDLNLKTIYDSMKEAFDNKADAILFGEAFLQGFDALKWDFACDRKIAISQENGIIEAISQKAKELGIAVGFGYLELSDDKIYSSYLFIDKTGIILNNYRRISPGWKEPVASEKHYREGEIFQTFSFMDKTFLLGLCGDFWYDENVKRANQIYKDVVLWPVYLNYTSETWNNLEKEEYATRAKLLGKRVLLFNSISLNPVALGGCYDYQNGNIIKDLPMENDGILYVEI